MSDALCRVGMVAVIGRPNVGKSTLINALVGERVSITSRKPQTTRDRVLGVRTTADAQFIFVDTPGFQRRHRNALNKRMNETVTGALADVDAVILVIDAHGWTAADEQVLQLLPKEFGQVILALNKTDLLTHREKLLPLMAESMQRFRFTRSSRSAPRRAGSSMSCLAEVRALLPEGMPLFDAEQYTDRSARFLATESIREKAYRLLGDELPYGIAVTIDRWEEAEWRLRGSPRPWWSNARPTRASSSARTGAKLREISRLARADIQEMLGKSVHLEVWVRVKKGWSDDPAALRKLGYG